MTLMTGERTAIASRPLRHADLVLGALDVAAVGGVDDDARAGADMRRDHDAAAVLELAGLVGRRRGLAAHHRIGLDHLASSRVCGSSTDSGVPS